MTLPSMIRIVCVACAALACQQCSSSLKQVENQALLPEIDIVQLKENSDEALKLAQEAKLDVQIVNTKLTEIDNRLMVLAEDMSNISLAKIEEIENRLSLLVEAYKDLQQQMAALQNMPLRGQKSASAPQASFSPSSAAGLLTSSEYDAYQNALRAFNSRTYDKARALFVEVRERYPDGTYAADAQYWLGECSYVQGQYADAIAAFEKVMAHTGAAKSDDAQLKIGLSYLKMGKTDHAKEAFTRLINRFPASEYVARAKKYLADIK